MFALPNGCSRSEFSVTPKNWKTVKATTKTPWRIIYRFYDPAFKKTKKWGKQIPIKGMNEFHQLEDRQPITQGLIDDEIARLKQGYNPITKRIIPPEIIGGNDSEISPTTGLNAAFDLALNKLECAPGTKTDVEYALVCIQVACRQLKLDQLPIEQIRIRHIMVVLEKVGKNKGGWTAPNFNHYRAYLMMLFSILVPLGNMYGNPVKDIQRKKVIKKIKEVLTDQQRIEVNDHLLKKDRRFWRFLHIFFHSGARITELMRLKKEHVDLVNQRIKFLVLKGQQYTEHWKPIKTIALELWEEVYTEAKPGQYLFSRNLVPGNKQINEDRITKRWRLLVKIPLGVTADFYSLKHLNSTETTDLLDEQAAADMNSHTSTAMVVKIYDVKREERKSKKNELLKAVNNPFA